MMLSHRISENQVSILKCGCGVEIYVDGNFIETFTNEFEDMELVKEILKEDYGFEFIEDEEGEGDEA